MDRFTNEHCQKMIDELNEYPTLEPQNHDIKECYEAIKSRNERINELEEERRWIPVSERLPKIHGETASDYVDVAYRYPGANYYFRKSVQFWKKHGWVLDFKDGNPVTFEEFGYVIDYWIEKMQSPLPPEYNHD